MTDAIGFFLLGFGLGFGSAGILIGIIASLAERSD